MPVARYGAGAAVLNGFLYAVGGENSNGTVNTVEWYNPWANSWIDVAPVPTTRYRLAAGVVNGILYALGGQNGTTYNTVETYNPATNTWSTAAPMLTARAALGVGVINGILYAVGGETIGGSLNNLEAYNPATNSWTALAAMPTGRAGMTVGVLNGLLYVAGGISTTGQGYSPLTTLEVYNPATNTWTTGLPGMPTARGFCSGGVMNGQLYVAGGETNLGLTGVLSTVESYNPSTNSWSTQASLPTAVNGSVAGVLNGNLYVAGGTDINNNPLALNQEGALVCGFSPTPTPTITLTPTITVSPTPCSSGPVTYFLTNGAANPQKSSTDNLDLTTTAGSAQDGWYNTPDTTMLTYPSGTSSFTQDCYFRPNMSWSSTTTAPGSTPVGYGWESPASLTGGIAAGTWAFSNHYQANLGSIAGSLAIYQEAAVYSVNPTTGAGTLLFTAVSPTNLETSLNTAYTTVAASFTVSEPAFPATAGQNIRVEFYVHETGSQVAQGNIYVGFNTSGDYVTMPGMSCAVPTATATPAVTSTFTPTPSKTPTRTVTATATPTATSTSTGTATSSPTSSATSTFTVTPAATFTPTKTSTTALTFTATVTATATSTPTWTSSPSVTFTGTATTTGTSTPTRTNTLTVTQTPTGTFTPTKTNTSVVTQTPTATFTSTRTLSPSATNTATRTNSPTITPTLTVSLTPTATHAGFTVAISGVSPACGGPGTSVAVTITWSGNTAYGTLDTVLGFASSTTPNCGVSWIGSESCSGTSVLNPTNIGSSPSGTYVWNTTVPANSPSGYILAGVQMNCGSVGTGATGNCGTDYWSSLPFSTTCGGAKPSDKTAGSFGGSSPTPTVTSSVTPGAGLIQSVVAGPNFSNGQQPIRFFLKLNGSAHVSLMIFTLTGEEVYSAGAQGSQGLNTLVWNVTNKARQAVSSGLYLYVLQADNGVSQETKTGDLLIRR
jgi:N-acetylneuraminic acid mutarotase